MTKYLYTGIFILISFSSLYGQQQDSLKLAPEGRSIRIVCSTPTMDHQPLWIIHLGDKKVELVESIHSNDSSIVALILPLWVDKIDVLKGADVIKQYGNRAENGVISLTLKEEYRAEMPLALLRKLEE